MTAARRVRWSSDVDTERDPARRVKGWQPYAADESGCVLFSIDMWFGTEAECDAWIRDTVIAAEHVAGDTH